MSDKKLGNKHLVNLHGIRFHITGDPSSEEAKKRIHAARLDVAQLKKTPLGQAPRFERMAEVQGKRFKKWDAINTQKATAGTRRFEKMAQTVEQRFKKWREGEDEPTRFEKMAGAIEQRFEKWGEGADEPTRYETMAEATEQRAAGWETGRTDKATAGISRWERMADRRLGIVRLERPGKYEIKGTRGKYEVRMTIPEVPMPAIERRPLEIDLIAPRYCLAFRAYNYTNDFQGLVLTGGLTWKGPYVFVPMEDESVLDPFWWGIWSQEFPPVRPYEKDPRSPVPPIKFAYYEGDSELQVIYPWHDGMADYFEYEYEDDIGNNSWTGAWYHVLPCYTAARVLAFCVRGATVNDRGYKTQWVNIPCCDKQLFTSRHTYYHQQGNYLPISWSLSTTGHPAYPDAMAYYDAVYADDSCFGGATPTFALSWDVYEANVVTEDNDLTFYTNRSWATYLSNGKGGGFYAEVPHPQTTTRTATPIAGNPALPWCGFTQFPYFTTELSTVVSEEVFSWTEKVVCDDTVYSPKRGNGPYNNQSGIEAQNVNPRYFVLPGADETGILALSIRRYETHDWDYWVFSPDLKIEEAEVQLKFSHRSGTARLALLPIRGPDGENLYTEGEFELVREMTRSKIQAGEV